MKKEPNMKLSNDSIVITSRHQGDGGPDDVAVYAVNKNPFPAHVEFLVSGYDSFQQYVPYPFEMTFEPFETKEIGHADSAHNVQCPVVLGEAEFSVAEVRD